MFELGFVGFLYSSDKKGQKKSRQLSVAGFSFVLKFKLPQIFLSKIYNNRCSDTNR